MPPETPSVKKPSKNKPPSSSPIKVVIAEGCIQKDPQKDTINSSKAQETELSLKPGSSLVMTHHINVVPGSCTGGCEAEMATLKDRLEILEKEMSALKKKCTVCSGVQCPNNCSKNGECVNGKCVCHSGFTGTACSKGTDKKNKVSSDSDTVKQESSSQELSKTNNTIISTNDKEKKHQTRGPTTVKKNPPNKDLPPNQNVTQSNNKKSSGMLTDLIKLPTKLSTNKTVLNSRNGKLSLFNVTFTKNVKKPSQNNDMKVLNGGAYMTQKNANATEELKGGDKKRNLNSTTSTKTDKKSTKQSVILLKDGSSEKKTEKHSNEKDKKLNKGNVTPLNKASLGNIQVDKHLNVNNATEKDRKSQSNATPLEEKTSGEGNVTTSSEKWKKVATGDGLFTPVNKSKTGQQHGNITVSTEKDNKLHQGNATHTKDESSFKTKKDSHLNGTMSLEKDKTLPQNNAAKVVILENKVGVRKKVDNINEKKSNEKGKKFLQGDEMKVIKKEEVNVSSTTTSEKDKNLQHSLKEDASSKRKVNSDLKNITISKTHVERTTKPTDVGPVAVHNITATGFVITWEAPQGVFRNFTVTKKEVWSGRSSEDDAEEAEKSPNGDLKSDEFISSNKTSSNVYTGKAERKSAEKFSQILAGSARSYHFKNLRPQRKYLVSLIGSGPHVRSKLHSLYVSTGPEPPTELLFSNITETSLILSWTKPKSTVTGFKVTYTNSANGVTGSMSVDSQLSHVLISKLSVGSRYEISIRSVMRAIKSEATTASIVTVPDSPTDLQAMNITDSKALLVWKPAEAKVDHYILIYGSTRSPNVTVTVMLSGNSVQHQLRGLHRSTLYAVKILSQINSLQSSSVSTTFTTKSGVKLQVVKPNEVTWNSAVISWKSTHIAFRSYRLTYQFGEEVKEVILNPTVSQYKLTDLVASSHYTVKVDGESEGQYISVVSTTFTTAQLPYQYPVECSQVQVNGMKESGEAEIYPQGKEREAVRVYCDMETDGGGWTVFQRRLDGSTDFFREWSDYREGFGELSAELWLGNDILHALTNTEPMSLRVDLRLGNDTAYAHYSNFSVGSEVNHYTIEVSGYSGTAGDSMKYHNSCPFSTNDKDPSNNDVQCAKKYMGGWWYKNCYKANLNGVYATFSKDQGVVWIDWKGKDISLPFAEMKLRPVSLSHVTPNTQG
ncbi:tenascin [Tachysurus vachellii]|uniref:tenascin n=1 Tax=Tachysurus vachellii TaxID=175792 RepID=UPI00296B3F6F|nr:tenascin [Tachysurus vachellii]